MENDAKFQALVPVQAHRMPTADDMVAGLNYITRKPAKHWLWILVPLAPGEQHEPMMYGGATCSGLTQAQCLRMLVRATAGLDALFEGYAKRIGADPSEIRRAIADTLAPCGAPALEQPPAAKPELPHPAVLGTLEKLNADLQAKCLEAEQSRKATDEALAQAQKLRDEAAKLRMDLDQARELARHYEHEYRNAIMRHEECAGFMARKSLELDALRKNLNEVSAN